MSWFFGKPQPAWKSLLWRTDAAARAIGGIASNDVRAYRQE
jgi:hypothetical protein